MKRRSSLFRSTSRRGFTLLELLVVVTIMIILAGSLMSGFATMSQTQRLNNGADKLISMLHQARSLAISNNAIYHVRVQDGGPVDAGGQWACVIDPSTGRPRPDDQMITVMRYTSISDAISVNAESKMCAGTPNAWSTLTITPAEAQQRYDQAMTQALALDATDPIAANQLRTRAQQTYINPATGQVYNNWRIDEVKLEPGTAIGIQGPAGTSQTPDKVIFFYPDGTASDTITFYVTDIIHSGVNGRTTANDFRDDRLNFSTYAERNTQRSKAYGERNPRIRMVQVMRGGMIKALKTEALP